MCELIGFQHSEIAVDKTICEDVSQKAAGEVYCRLGKSNREYEGQEELRDGVI
ncbi:MAG: hypothetical protein IJ661_09530 [Lachnospiraceae bacterium]|nr:hypothetical protein [Lachnospiraceae bacterium]